MMEEEEEEEDVEDERGVKESKNERVMDEEEH